MLNVIVIRRDELFMGIEILDDRDRVVGKSYVAGRSAVAETAVSRLVMAGSVLLIPPVLMNVTRCNALPPRCRIPVELLAITAGAAGVLPAAVSIFPQKGSLLVSTLEQDLRDVRDLDGGELEMVSYHKGL